MALPKPTADSYALITGASQGLGMAMAKDLARMGHNIILVARREALLKNLAEHLVRAHGVRAEVYACNLADAEERASLIEFMGTKTITTLINSAGVASFGPFKDQDWDYETTQFALNATAVFELTQAVLPGMLERKEGAICNVGSAAGNVPIPNNATYVLTKAGINAFTEALHYELRGTGVHCTLVAPGPIREANIPEESKSKVDKVVPDFLWANYEDSARASLEALSANKRRFVPGLIGKTMNALSAVTPTAVVAPIVGHFYSKMA